MFDVSSIKAKSLGGAKFWLLVMDDATGYVWSYFIKKKSEVAERQEANTQQQDDMDRTSRTDHWLVGSTALRFAHTQEQAGTRKFLLRPSLGRNHCRLDLQVLPAHHRATS